MDADAQVFETGALGEVGDGFVGEGGAVGSEVDVERYGADGVLVHGVDHAEVVEEETAAGEAEALEAVEEAGADEIDVYLAGELGEFCGFWRYGLALYLYVNK